MKHATESTERRNVSRSQEFNGDVSGLIKEKELQPPRGAKISSRVIGKNWQGKKPEFRNLRWVRSSGSSALP